MRLFFGFDLPADQARALFALLPPATREVRPVAAHRMHVTMRFVGSVEPRVRDVLASGLAGLDELVRQAAPRIGIAGCGVYPGIRRARVLWAGLWADGALFVLQRAVERLCRSAGLVREKGEWRPHVTLARFAGGPPEWLADFLDRNADLVMEPFDVRRVTLFDSRTLPTGPVYTAVAVAGE